MMSCYMVPRYKHVQNRSLFLTPQLMTSPKSSVTRLAIRAPQNFTQGFAAIHTAFTNEDNL